MCYINPQFINSTSVSNLLAVLFRHRTVQAPRDARSVGGRRVVGAVAGRRARRREGAQLALELQDRLAAVDAARAVGRRRQRVLRGEDLRRELAARMASL